MRSRETHTAVVTSYVRDPNAGNTLQILVQETNVLDTSEASSVGGAAVTSGPSFDWESQVLPESLDRWSFETERKLGGR